MVGDVLSIDVGSGGSVAFLFVNLPVIFVGYLSVPHITLLQDAEDSLPLLT